MKKNFSVSETAVFTFLMILLSLVVSIVLIFVANLFFSHDVSGGVAKNGLVVSLSGIIISSLTWLLLIRHIKENLSTSVKDYLGFLPIKKIALVVWFCVSFLYVFLISWAANYWNIPLESSFLRDIYSSTTQGWLVIIFVIIFAPFLEEVLYRGYVYSGCIASMGVLPTILITSLIWTVIHLQYDLFQMLYLFGLGLILGFSRHQTNSIVTPLILHVLFNFSAVIDMFLGG